jgi:ribonuclease HIII
MENNTITLTVNDEQIGKMIAFYNTNVVDNNNEYVLKQFKLEKVAITIYTSKKVVFQGENAQYEASIWDNSLIVKAKEKKVETNGWKYLKDHIGSDEVGTGDYFGPICVCAAFVKHSDLEFLNEIKIDDSKKLSDEHIRTIAPLILKRIPYSQISLDPKKYNSLIKQGYNKAKIKSILHNQVIHNLRDKVNKRAVLTVIDQFISEARYYDYVKFSPYVEGQIHFETKSESKYPAVAVASIIARYSFLIKMDAISASLNKQVPKGAGKEVDLFAKEIVNEYGKDKLNEIAKVHFANTKKIEE